LLPEQHSGQFQTQNEYQIQHKIQKARQNKTTTLHSQQNEINSSAGTTATAADDDDDDNSLEVTFFWTENTVVFILSFI
jgi:hypothetical protein